MSTILPPAATGPIAPAQTAPPLLTVAGGGAAAEVAAMPAGSVLEAVVLPQQGQARNLLEVMTTGGALLLRVAPLCAAHRAAPPLLVEALRLLRLLLCDCSQARPALLDNAPLSRTHTSARIHMNRVLVCYVVICA